jgi:hypothetical protein
MKNLFLIAAILIISDAAHALTVQCKDSENVGYLAVINSAKNTAILFVDSTNSSDWKLSAKFANVNFQAGKGPIIVNGMTFKNVDWTQDAYKNLAYFQHEAQFRLQLTESGGAYSGQVEILKRREWNPDYRPQITVDAPNELRELECKQY